MKGGFQYTDHARIRMAQRGITEQDVARVILVGMRVRNAGAVFHFMRKKDIKSKSDERLEGVTVLRAKNGVVMTVYKNKKGLRDIKRKWKLNLKELKETEGG